MGRVYRGGRKDLPSQQNEPKVEEPIDQRVRPFPKDDFQNNEKSSSTEKIERYGDYYDDDKLEHKVDSILGKVGKELLYNIFLLYYTLKDPETPLQSKGIIIGALGYLILPLDVIPDMIPVAGFTDDASAISIAIATVSNHITPAIKAKAKQKVDSLIG